MANEFHECECEACQQSKDHLDWQIHHQMNVFLSRLDEQQRRWYVGLESKKIGHGRDDASWKKICGTRPQSAAGLPPESAA